MNCKICNKHLYENLDLRTLFRWNYTYHIECEDYLYYPVQSEIIPIENNIIELVYYLPKNLEINYDFVFFMSGMKLIEYILKDNAWSMIYFYDDSYFDLNPLAQYLFLSLSQGKIIFLSESDL